MTLPPFCRAILIAIACATFAPSGSAFDCATQAAAKICTSDNTEGDIQAALNHIDRVIAEDDWTLVSGNPGETIALTRTLGISMSHSFTWKSATPGNRATITSSYTGGIGIYVQQRTPNKLITIQDFRMTDWDVSGRWIQVEGGGEIFRVLNCYIHRTRGSEYWLWTSTQGTGVFDGEGPFGLVANNEILYCGMFIRQNLGSPDAEWSNDHALVWGTRRAVFVEYNTIVGYGGASSFTDGNQAGKLVIRHNNVTNTLVAWHGRDSAATANRCKHSFLAGEIYGNTFNYTTTMNAALVEIRGGTALVYENGVNVTGSIAVGAQLQAYCAGGTWSNCYNASDCTPMSGPLRDPNDPQLPGFPTAVRVWSNGNKEAFFYDTWGASDNSLTPSPSHYTVSDDDSAKPAGYTPFTDPHPLNPGPGLAAPSNNVPPAISGILTAGQTISLGNGGWSGYPAPTFSRQLMQCNENGEDCSDIPGATEPTYDLLAAQAGKKLQLKVVASNAAGAAVAYSAITDLVVLPGIENLLQNPGFEKCSAVDDVVNNVATWAGWTAQNGGGYVFPSSNSHGGVRAYRVFRAQGAAPSLAQSFLTTPGASYTFSFWQMTDTPNNPLYYAVLDNPSGRYLRFAPAPASVGTYAKTEVKFTAISSSTAIQFFSALLAGAESVWLDSVVVAPTYAAASREVHGAGDEAMSFDLDLPLAGAPAVECRQDVSTVVFRFANSITSVSGATIASGVARIQNHYLGNDPHEYIVELADVVDAQYLTIVLDNVTESTGNVIVSAAAELGVLLGDVNGDRTVNSGDVTLCGNHAGESTTRANYRFDLNGDGAINSGDVTIARNQSGTELQQAAPMLRLPLRDLR